MYVYQYQYQYIYVDGLPAHVGWRSEIGELGRDRPRVHRSIGGRPSIAPGCTLVLRPRPFPANL